jgi:hypothetical protein
MTTRTRRDSIDVAAAMRQAGTSVMEQAKAKFDADVVTYREGVRRMAESGGTLPPDEADVLLRACRDLDIPVERMEQDVVTVIRHGRAAEKIADILARNQTRGEHAARLERDLEVERQQWLAVKSECDQRLKAAEAKLEAARRAFEQASRAPDERADEPRAECRRLEDTAPHLFNSVEPEQLRRIMRPSAGGIHPWK